MTPLLIAVLIYILLIICIYSFKPKICFSDKGKMKSFGIGKNKTPFTFLGISIVLGIFALVISIIYTDYMIPAVEDVLEEAQQVAQQAAKLLAENS